MVLHYHNFAFFNLFSQSKVTFSVFSAAIPTYLEGVERTSSCIFVNSVAVDKCIVCGPPPWAAVEKAPAQGTVNWHWGNPYESYLMLCNSTFISVWMDPVLCDPDNDNFFLTGGLPNDTTLIGALPPGNSTSDVLSTTVPPDDLIGTYSSQLLMTLQENKSLKSIQRKCQSLKLI